jgi:Methyltransferase domain
MSVGEHHEEAAVISERLTNHVGGWSPIVSAEVAALARARASTMMDERELTFLAAALAASPAGDGDTIVVEIGTYLGESAIFMAEVLAVLNRGASIFSIDAFDLVEPDPLNPQGSYSDFHAAIVAHGLQRTVMAVSGYSDAVAPLVAPIVALLVVDGGHSYDIALRDLELYAPKLVPGAYLFIDDYGSAYPGVVRAVDDFLASTAGFEVVHRSDFVVARRR